MEIRTVFSVIQYPGTTTGYLTIHGTFLSRTEAEACCADLKAPLRPCEARWAVDQRLG